jgi:hypothetical protein
MITLTTLYNQSIFKGEIMKYITLSSTDIEKLVEEFRSDLTNLRSNQEKISFEKSFKDIRPIEETQIKKPIIYFSADAWNKMNALVQSSDKELAWQATVEKKKFKGRENTDDFFYYIDQVFVYPQEVTAAFVATDEVQYTEWSLQLPDEVFNNLRFQGHSHVNMAVMPSGTDQNTYQNFLDQLDKNDFYIFMILNKRREFTILVYDFTQNIIFETKDCYVDVLTKTGSLKKWIEENKKQISEKKTPTYPHTPWAGNWDAYDKYKFPNYNLNCCRDLEEQTSKNKKVKGKKK